MMMMRQQQQYQQYQQPLATPSEPRPIPINGSRPSNNRLHTATSSSELLSKSLGDMPTLATALQRCSSAVSGIKHRGYLLKRSNHPYRPATADDDEKIERCLFPVDGASSDDDGWNSSEPLAAAGMRETLPSSLVLHPKPHAWEMQDESSWANQNGIEAASYQHLEFGIPHKPQHVLNEEQEAAPLLIMPPLPTLWQNGVSQHGDDDPSSASLAVNEPWNMLAAFFGMSHIDVAEQLQEQLEPEFVSSDVLDEQTLHSKLHALVVASRSESLLIAPQYGIKRSSPISFGRSSSSSSSSAAAAAAAAADVATVYDDEQHDNHHDSNDGSDYNSRNRRMSAPSSSSSSGDLPPSDVLDPNDEHLWRSKYCILEDGVLYFYRNKHEGESSEARLERNNSRSVFDDVYDLSKSPMPRPSRLLLTSPDNHNQFLWEKRVALENVGAVRSAELEFGPNSFELVANVIDDEEDEDNNRYKNHSDDEDDHNGSNKLILRAASQKEMQEWLFQFHRSVARYFMKLVEGISHQNNFMDLHHPSFQQPRMMTAPISPSPHDSPVLHPGSLMLSAFSPRLRMPQSSVPLNAQPSTSLSHGHGRIAMRRRRVDDRSKTSADQVTKPRNYRDVSPGESTPEHDTMQTLPFSMTPSEEQARVPDSVFYPRTLPALPSPTETSPEISAPMSVCPETERPRPSAGKYIPPHLRNQQQQNGNTGSTGGKYVPPSVRRRQQQQAAEKGNDIKLLSLQERAAVTPHHQQAYSQEDAVSDVSLDPQLESAGWEQSPVTNLANCVPLKLGGCADPLVAVGSILDTIYTSKKASKVGKVFTEPFGCLSGDAVAVPTKSVGRAGGLQWEIGAVSECGVRESNEDSYVIAADLHLMLDSLCDDSSASSSGTNKEKTSSRNSLFALFDGHCGNQAARFAAEKLPTLIRDQYTVDGVFVGSFGSPSKIEEALRNAIVRLDEDFCRLCVEGGRDWESGTTALVAMLANENLVIANVGDCRGVVCRCVDDSSSSMASHLEQNGWKKLNISNKVDESDDEDEDSKWMRAMASDPDDEDNGSAKKPASKSCYWRQVTDVHSPGRATERARIEGANGWITTETEIPIGQLHRVDLWDGDVIEILKRCLSDPRILQIARVCGELAVSRAIGDRDFKAAYNKKSESAADNNVGGWDSPLFLPYPDEHNRSFVGDLVSGVPDFDTLKVGEPGISDEFLLLACDGLWDVLDPDDAVNITRGLLFKQKISAERAAARLAELAMHLGSSDNITVIVVRFFRGEPLN